MADKFEIAFSFDTTGSMYKCLEEVRKRLGEMVRDLKVQIPGIRIAIFAHGDYCDAGSAYVTKYIDFTDDVSTLCNFVSTVSRTSGGDEPECYELVMREVQEKLSWSHNSQKALVMIGDAPPHEKSEDQNYRHLDWKEEAERLRDKDIKIYAVLCNGRTGHEHFYQHISSATFGYYMPLSNFNEVKSVLMKICFREAGLENSGSSPVIPTLSSYSSPATTTVTHRPPSPKRDESPKDMYMDSEDSDSENDAGLQCYMCKISKLANEFPSVTVSDECEHNPGICLRCVVKYVHENGSCPQDGCYVSVDPECLQIKIFEVTLKRMFLDYTEVLKETRTAGYGGSDVITVSTMNGDTAWIPYCSTMTISQLKAEVQKKLDIKETQQKLLYNEKGLKANKGPGQPYRLSDYGIEKNASISLILPLYCIPENLDHVVFDLSWEFPKNKPDFLDASCFAFNGTKFIQVIDWNHSKNSYYLKDAVEHSAKNELTSGGRIGHQTIHVYLKRLPSTVSHIYFTLSSWKSPNLSAFSNPSLQFYDASEPSMNLCGTTFGHALESQAVVMCSLKRVGPQWQIYECDAGGCVNGNSKKYNPIRQRIAEFIADDE